MAIFVLGQQLPADLRTDPRILPAAGVAVGATLAAVALHRRRQRSGPPVDSERVDRSWRMAGGDPRGDPAGTLATPWSCPSAQRSSRRGTDFVADAHRAHVTMSSDGRDRVEWRGETMLEITADHRCAQPAVSRITDDMRHHQGCQERRRLLGPGMAPDERG